MRSECKPLPRPKLQPKVIGDSNPDFWINPDLNRISAGSLLTVLHSLYLYLAVVLLVFKLYFNTEFCCVMLCISVIYAMVSSWVSVTFMYSIETSKHIVKRFTPSGSHTILVFQTKSYGNSLTGTP